MERKILAFVHIKKCAGTTLTHILRLNFFLRHCDVRCLSETSSGIFQAKDMNKLMRINPLVKCIAGHEVKPFGNLVITYPGIRFITLLRDPVQRYISQYHYNTEKLGSNLSFDDFLKTKRSFNKQTRAIAGSEDLVTAKDILNRFFFLVGIVEEFDEFLILLKKKLEPLRFRPGYRVQNVANKHSPMRRSIEKQLHKYHEQIIERNLLDIELYNYVKNDVLPKAKKEYGPTFEHDVAQFKKSKKTYSRNLLRYLDYVYRKCYFGPILKTIRKANGL